MLFVEISRRTVDVGKPRVEVGVAERAFSSQTAPSVHAFRAVGVLTGGEHHRAWHVEVFQTDWTGLALYCGPNYPPQQLLSASSAG